MQPTDEPTDEPEQSVQPAERSVEQNPEPAPAPAPSPKPDEPEQILKVLYKHLFGLFIMYFQAFVALIAAFALLYFLLPSVLDKKTAAHSGSLVIALGFLFFIAVVFILILVTIVYRGNKLVLSNHNIREFDRTGLFTTKNSQLSLANIEDVTASQQGIFAAIFGYGLITIETAGEQDNFEFSYCPKARKTADLMLKIRADYIEKHPGQAS